MLQKFGKKVMNNFGLKILAVLFAVVLWIVVVNIDDPSNSKPYTTSVSLENKSYITSMGKWADYLDGKNTITFSVYAKRSVHNTLTNANFTATADAQKIEYDEKTGTYRVPVVVTCNRNNSSINITSKDLYLDLELEDSASKQFPIKTNTTGTVASGCALGDVEITDANVMKVSGPASVVNQIDTVVATINVDGMSTDITDRVTPVFYDAQGEVVDTTKLTLSVSTVNISAQILNTKDVELEFLTTGTPADGYEYLGCSSEPASVQVCGKEEALSQIESINIPASELSIDGATEKIEKAFDITDYLPEGVELIEGASGKVTATAMIEQLGNRTIEFMVASIKQNYLAKNLQVSYEPDAEVTLVFQGEKDTLDSLDISNAVSVNLQNYTKEGTYDIPVEVDLPDGVTLTKPVTVQLTLTEKESTEDEQPENDAETN